MLEHTKSVFLPSTNNKTIWRYMTLAKYVACIQGRYMPFTSPQGLHPQDPTEGYLSEAEVNHVVRAMMDEVFIPRFGPLSLEDYGQRIRDNPDLLRLVEKKCKRFHLKALSAVSRFHISCWHYNNDESLAMWSLYCDNSTESVAIKVRYPDLLAHYDADPDNRYLPGEVTYSAAANDKILFYKPRQVIKDRDFNLGRLFRKYGQLKHEQEFRIVHTERLGDQAAHDDKDDSTIFVSFPYESFPYEVVLHPLAKPWVYRTLFQIHEDAHLNTSIIKKSSLKAPRATLDQITLQPGSGTYRVTVRSRGGTLRTNLS